MSIASGSSGNAAYVGNGSTHILIDAGVSKKRILEGLHRLGLSLNDMTAILITHEHSDHISSLPVLTRAAHIPVYATSGSFFGIKSKLKDEFSRIESITICPGQTFLINDIEVTPFPVSHDAFKPVCYRFDDRTSSCGIITDLGCFDHNLVDMMQNLDAALVEANHDVRMLETGPYPYPLKRRIAGDRGHLSNDLSGKLISSLLHDRMQYIALGHLSKQNNFSDLAQLTVNIAIDEAQNKYHSGDFRLDVASQECGTDIYEF